MGIEATDPSHPWTQFTEPNLLLVEGKEEVRFFRALIAHLGIEHFQVQDYHGKSRLHRNLRSIRITPGFDNVVFLCVERDADQDPSAAFASVQSALQDAALPTPTSSVAAVGHSPRVIVVILPDGNRPGMLEDACLDAAASDPAMPCVDEYLDCLQRKGLQGPRPVSKARVHAFLASRPKPDKRLGEAAEAGYWPWSAPAFAQIKGVLQEMASHNP